MTTISKRKLSLVVDLFIIAFSVIYFVLSFFIKEGASLSLSSSFYPRLLAGLLLAMGLISLYVDLFGNGKKVTATITLGDLRKQLSILICIICFVLVWQKLKIFYPAVFVETLILVWLFNQETPSRSKAIKTLAVAIIFTLFVFAVFGVGLSIKFT